MRTCIRRLLLAFLVTILALTPFTIALASPPEIITIEVNDTFELVECNGFTVFENLEGTVKFSTHFDIDGNLMMEIIRAHLVNTLSNSETGESISSPNGGIDKTTVYQDGSATFARTGVILRLVEPGEGLIFAYLGYIVFDVNTGEVVFEAGQHGDFPQLEQVLCSVLE